MEAERFDQLLEEKKSKPVRMQPGDRVDALIVGVSGEHVFLDVGGKSEGVMAAAELRNEAGELSAAEGDRVQVYLLSNRNGELIFTARLGGHGSRELEEAFQAGIPVQGTVSAEVKGGFSVMVAGQRCFCPYSQMDIRRVESADEYLNKTLSFRVMEYSNRGRNILVSARAVLEEERQRQREKLVQELQVGMQVAGVVSSIRDFGAFVDLGGVDGLIPIGELAWGQTERVSDVLSRGDKVQVVIKALDWERDRISLSLRDTLPNPWNAVQSAYPVGSRHQGRVVRLAPFGAFVSLEPGVDGLVHISRLGAGRKLHHPREAVELGQELSVQVEGVDLAQRRISLAPADWEPAGQEPGDKASRSPREGGGHGGHERQGERREAFKMPAGKPLSMGTLGDVFAKAEEQRKKR